MSTEEPTTSELSVVSDPLSNLRRRKIVYGRMVYSPVPGPAAYERPLHELPQVRAWYEDEPFNDDLVRATETASSLQHRHQEQDQEQRKPGIVHPLEKFRSITRFAFNRKLSFDRAKPTYNSNNNLNDDKNKNIINNDNNYRYKQSDEDVENADTVNLKTDEESDLNGHQFVGRHMEISSSKPIHPLARNTDELKVLPSEFIFPMDDYFDDSDEDLHDGLMNNNYVNDEMKKRTVVASPPSTFEPRSDIGQSRYYVPRQFIRSLPDWVQQEQLQREQFQLLREKDDRSNENDEENEVVNDEEEKAEEEQLKLWQNQHVDGVRRRRFPRQVLQGLPTMSPPKLPSLPQLPNIDPKLPSLPQLPKVDLPNVNLSTLPQLPKVDLPNVNLSTLPQLPKVDLPNVNLSTLPQLPNLPKLDSVPDLSKLNQKLLPNISLPHIDLPKVPDLPLSTDSLNAMRAFNITLDSRKKVVETVLSMMDQLQRIHDMFMNVEKLLPRPSKVFDTFNVFDFCHESKISQNFADLHNRVSHLEDLLTSVKCSQCSNSVNVKADEKGDGDRSSSSIKSTNNVINPDALSSKIGSSSVLSSKIESSPSVSRFDSSSDNVTPSSASSLTCNCSQQQSNNNSSSVNKDDQQLQQQQATEKRRDDLIQNVDLRMAVVGEPGSGKKIKTVVVSPELLARSMRNITDSLNGKKGLVSICYHNQPPQLFKDFPNAPFDTSEVHEMFAGSMDAAHSPSTGIDLDKPNYVNTLMLDLKSLDRDFISLCIEDTVIDSNLFNPAKCINLRIRRKQ